MRNIATSEQEHVDAILYLINGYGLTDPVVDGNFTPAFQDLYYSYIAKGSSLMEAFEVGVAIEELDIADLKDCLSSTAVPNLVEVYTKLLAASEKHLSAFQTQL